MRHHLRIDTIPTRPGFFRIRRKRMILPGWHSIGPPLNSIEILPALNAIMPPDQAAQLHAEWLDEIGGSSQSGPRKFDLRAIRIDQVASDLFVVMKRSRTGWKPIHNPAPAISLFALLTLTCGSDEMAKAKYDQWIAESGLGQFADPATGIRFESEHNPV